MDCELCGRKGQLTYAIVEGVMLKVCSDCSKLGKTVLVPEIKTERILAKPEKEQREDVEVIVPNYSTIVKTAREKKGLKQGELAKDIGEKESVISQIEAGGMKPNFKLARKLGVYLGINLIEIAERIDMKNETKDIDFKDKTLTLGDLLKKQK